MTHAGERHGSLRLTRTWVDTRIVAVAGLLTMWATTGTWDTEETVMAITVIAAALRGLLGVGEGSANSSVRPG